MGTCRTAVHVALRSCMTHRLHTHSYQASVEPPMSTEQKSRREINACAFKLHQKPSARRIAACALRISMHDKTCCNQQAARMMAGRRTGVYAPRALAEYSLARCRSRAARSLHTGRDAMLEQRSVPRGRRHWQNRAAQSARLDTQMCNRITWHATCCQPPLVCDVHRPPSTME